MMSSEVNSDTSQSSDDLLSSEPDNLSSAPDNLSSDPIINPPSSEPDAPSSEPDDVSSGSSDASVSSDVSSSSSCDTKFHLVATDKNTKTGVRQGTKGTPLHMVASVRARTAKIEAILDDGEWDSEEPEWESPDLVEPENGAKEVNWRVAGGEDSVGTHAVRAAACKTEEKVDIKIHDPSEEEYTQTADDLLGGLGGNISSLLQKWNITQVGVTGQDSKIEFKKELADVYNDPDVKWNVEADGTAEIGLASQGTCSLAGVKVTGDVPPLPPGTDAALTLKGGVTYSCKGVKHDWSKPDGSAESGWKGQETMSGNLLELSIMLAGAINLNIGPVEKIELRATGTINVGVNMAKDLTNFRFRAYPNRQGFQTIHAQAKWRMA